MFVVPLWLVPIVSSENVVQVRDFQEFRVPDAFAGSKNCWHAAYERDSTLSPTGSSNSRSGSLSAILPIPGVNGEDSDDGALWDRRGGGSRQYNMKIIPNTYITNMR